MYYFVWVRIILITVFYVFVYFLGKILQLDVLCALVLFVEIVL